MNSSSTASPRISHFSLSPLPSAPTTRPKDWICGFGGAKLAYTPDAMAQDIVGKWFPDGASHVVASTPGWSGMASYKVTRGANTYHMKVMIPDLEEGQRAASPSETQVQSIMREAARAEWAGRLGIAPAVVAMDKMRGAYACTFIDGRLPSPEEAQGPLFSGYLKTLKALHQAPTDGMPRLTSGRNWLFDIDSRKCLTEADAPRSEDFQHDLLRLEAGLTHFLERTPFPKTPVHGDLKLDNTLVSDRVLFLDWGNLHLDDPMTDLGCLLAMVDLPATETAKALGLYDAQGSHAPQDIAAEDPSRLLRLEANTALLRLKNCTFYDQWNGTKPKAEYLYQTLVNELPRLAAGVLRESGMKP